MDALNLLQVLWRRWLLTLLLLVIVAGAVFALASQVAAEYQSQGVALVIRESQAPVDGSGRRENPYGAIDRSLGATASLLVTVLTSPVVQQDLQAQGMGGRVEVTNDGSSIDPESPFLTVSATASDPREAAEAVKLVLARAAQELADRQNALPGELAERLGLVVIVPPPAGEQIRAGLLRAVVLAAAAGLVLVLVLIVAIDRLSPRASRIRLPRALQVSRPNRIQIPSPQTPQSRWRFPEAGSAPTGQTAAADQPRPAPGRAS